MTLDSSLERELGLDSLARVELVLRLEREFEASFPEQALASAETPRDLLRFLLASRGQAPQAVDRTLARLAPMTPMSEGVRPPEHAQTLTEALEYYVERQPDRLTIFLYEDQGERQITYRDLWQGATAYAAGLAASGLSPGQTVAIMLPTSKEYLFCFYGTLLAGGIPVPLYPPARLTTIEDHLTRHVGILKSCGAALMVTIPEAKPIAWLLRAQVESLRAVMVPADFPESASSFTPVKSQRRANRLSAIHLRQHRPAERRGADARQPARQRARDGQGGARQLVRRVRELAAALPRHGTDRRLLRHDVLELSGGADVAARVPRAAEPVAARDPSPPRHDVGRAELLLRALPAPHPRPRGRGHRPVVVALRLQRRRAGEPRNHERVQREIRQVRIQQERDDAGVRPRRGVGRPRVHAAGHAVAGRSARPRRISRAPAKRCWRARDDPAPLKVVACGSADSRPRPARGRRRGARAARPLGGLAAVPRPFGDHRLLPQPGSDQGAVRRRVGQHRRPRLPLRRRALHHRTREGHHHPRRAQHQPLRARGGGGRHPGRAPRLRRGVRQPGPGERHRAHRGARRDPPERHRDPGVAEEDDQRPRPQPDRRAGRRHRARAAAHRAEDLQRQDPPRGGARLLRARPGCGAPAGGVAAVHPPRRGRRGAAAAPRLARGPRPALRPARLRGFPAHHALDLRRSGEPRTWASPGKSAA